MTLLDFARGPAIHASLIILAAGIVLRLVGVLALTRGADLSRPRDAFGNFKGYRTVFSRAWPSSEFNAATVYQTVMAYVFHIATLLVVIGIVPHIEFITSLTGASWPGLPNFIGVALGTIALVSVEAGHLQLDGRRLHHLDHCRAAVADRADGFRYETMLALHILSAALLFAYMPFSKLMHAFWFIFSRAQSGLAYAHKGVRI